LIKSSQDRKHYDLNLYPEGHITEVKFHDQSNNVHKDVSYSTINPHSELDIDFFEKDFMYCLKW